MDNLKPELESHGPSKTTMTSTSDDIEEDVVVATICQGLPQSPSKESGDESPFLYMPAEWEEHEVCLILFPHNPITFQIDLARKEVWNVARAIANEGKEKVILLVKDEDMMNEPYIQDCQKEDQPNIQWVICPSNDTWVRDSGPTCCYWKKKKNLDDDEPKMVVVGIDWAFNSYGMVDEIPNWPCEEDQMIAKTLCQDILHVPSISIPMILEGGSIHTDGEGTLIVTKECLLNPNRNPHLSQEQISQVLQRTLGVSVIIWLPFGIDCDEDTNGHVDNFCCFSSPGHVVLTWTNDEENENENYHRCRQAMDVLLNTKDAKGRNLTVHKLPIPSPAMSYTLEESNALRSEYDPTFVFRQPNEKMAGSYVNFYISNQAVVVPQFGLATTDKQAIDILQGLFPTRTIVGVQSREILLGGGNIHCITQQIPKEK